MPFGFFLILSNILSSLFYVSWAGDRELPEMGNHAALQIFTAAAFCSHAPFFSGL